MYYYLFSVQTSWTHVNTDLGPNGASSTLMNIGDEPDFLIPYLYSFINKNYQTVSHVQMLIDQYFSAGLDGIPGTFLVLVLIFIFCEIYSYCIS